MSSETDAAPRTEVIFVTVSPDTLWLADVLSEERSLVVAVGTDLPHNFGKFLDTGESCEDLNFTSSPRRRHPKQATARAATSEYL